MNRQWWKESVVYQIYPRSFNDSDGDGIGDIPGIIAKLDYLEALGVDVVWLSPVYKSPNDDMGYDISDYRDIMDEFGTLADWERMLEEMHARGIKLVMDLVVNHTSDEHAWFIESRSSKDNPYRNYYIWRPGADGKEPNNWASFFRGSAWQYDETTDEYYLHLFSTKQPDLNWENPDVRRSVFDMMHWWLARGVDGFRMDVINLISKVPGLPDAAVTSEGPYQWGGEYFVNGPRLMEFLCEMRRDVLDKYDIMTVGETPMVDTGDAVMITHPETGALNMVFQFEHMQIDADPRTNIPKDWTLRELKEIMTRWQVDLQGKGWNSLYLNNHDFPRSVSRFGDEGRYRVASAKMLATFNHLLQGTPFIYQGEEIGMTNVAFESIEDYRDISTINTYREMIAAGIDRDLIMWGVHKRSRDNARTPMQWSDSPNAGFTTGEPWIKVNPNYKEINVAAALGDPDSIFYYYHKLIRLRRENPVMVYGLYELILPEHERIYAFTRSLEEERLLVILNFSAGEAHFTLPAELPAQEAELMIANYAVDEIETIEKIALRPYEARVYRFARN